MTTVQGDVKDQESIRDLKATPVQKDATTPNMSHPTMLGVFGQQCCVRLHGA